MSEELSEMKIKLMEHEKRIKALEDAFAGSRNVEAIKVKTSSKGKNLADKKQVTPEKIDDLFDLFE